MQRVFQKVLKDLSTEGILEGISVLKVFLKASQ